MIPGRSYSGPYMIPGRSWQDHSKEMYDLYGAIIWSDCDRPGRETRDEEFLAVLLAGFVLEVGFQT